MKTALKIAGFCVVFLSAFLLMSVRLSSGEGEGKSLPGLKYEPQRAAFAAEKLQVIQPREIEGVYHLFLPYWAQGLEIPHDNAIKMYGSRIPTIFIETASGCLEFIHESQENRERVEFLFVDEFGRVVHEGGGDMNGRGNSTWLRPKRPYNFRLDAGVYLPLFGLGAGRHWTLLANYIDHLRVRNTIALNLAREVGISHTSGIRPVDVFINGEYAGVFDLVERRSLNHAVHLRDLEAATSVVNGGNLGIFPAAGVHDWLPGTIKYFDIPHNPADISGGYLLEVQFHRRYMLEYSGFVTRRGMAVNLRAPRIATRAQVEYISDMVQRLEDALHADDGRNSAGEHFSDLLCVYSFARLYILEEFFLNVDAGNSSFFMYKEAGSERIHAGPPWDYDFSMGVRRDMVGTYLRDPRIFWVNRVYVNFEPWGTPTLYNLLYRHEIFREVVSEIWREEFAPAIAVLVGLEENSAVSLRTIDEYIADIAASVEMDSLIWPRREGHSFSGQSLELTDFARERFFFLDSYWR